MNRFYLFFAIFLIQFIGFAQIQLSVVEGTQTNYCLSSNQSAQVLVTVDTLIQGINGTDIEYIVLDSFDNIVDSGNFNDSFQKIIFFNRSNRLKINRADTICYASNFLSLKFIFQIFNRLFV